LNKGKSKLDNSNVESRVKNKDLKIDVLNKGKSKLDHFSGVIGINSSAWENSKFSEVQGGEREPHSNMHHY
jgi:hypothetical protein